jgi:hypothetical protein
MQRLSFAVSLTFYYCIFSSAAKENQWSCKLGNISLGGGLVEVIDGKLVELCSLCSRHLQLLRI